MRANLRCFTCSLRCSLRCRPRRSRRNIRRGRFASCCRSPRARCPTSRSAFSPTSSARGSTPPSWSRTSRAPAAPPRRWRPRPRRRTATRWSRFSSSTAISVSLLKALPYDPVGDFMPISGISTFANIIAVNAGSKYRTLGDILRAARERPGALNIGTTTVGSTNHLAANLLKSMTGLRLRHRAVPHARRSAHRRAAQRRRSHHPVLWRAEIGGRRQSDPRARHHHAKARGLRAGRAHRGRGRRERLRRGDLEWRLCARPAPRPR